MQHPRPFTGWHMTGILVAGFAVVIAVNMVMATMAVRSFGGVVVENSYVASQKFNGWLAQARAQQKLGWQDQTTLDAGRHVRMTLNVEGALIDVVAEHPLGRAPAIALRLREAAPGLYRSDRPLPAGRWLLRFTIRHDRGTEHLLREVD